MYDLIFVGQSLYLFEVLPDVLAKGSVGCTCSLRHLDTCLGDQTINKPVALLVFFDAAQMDEHIVCGGFLLGILLILHTDTCWTDRSLLIKLIINNI